MGRSIYGEDGDPLDYPGLPIQRPYFVSRGHVYQLNWSWRERDITLADGRRLREVLTGLGAEPLSARVVQVAYGANSNVTNIAWKFANYALPSGRVASPHFIALPGFIRDADVVACNIGYWGYVNAALSLHRPGIVDRSYLQGCRAPVTVLLVDSSQMEAIHLSEGVPQWLTLSRQHVSYDVGVTDVEVLGRVLAAQTYAPVLPLMSFDGKRPVAFRRVETRGSHASIPRLNQREIWAEILARLTHRIQALANATSIHDVVEMIRVGALARFGGGAGSGDAGQRLFETIRAGIVEEISLVDADGCAATGLRGLSSVRPGLCAWKPDPILAMQITF